MSWHHNRKRSPQESSYRALFNRTMQNAKRRKIEWRLTFDEFVSKVTQPCVWCQVSPSEAYNACISKNGYTQRHTLDNDGVREGWITYNGLDRIENNGIYEVTNVWPCCKFCNFARNNRTVEEFQVWLRLVADTWINK